MSSIEAVFIDTESALHELCQRLSQQPVLALDTEFMREKTYYAQLCLVQIADDSGIACVDPLALEDISPLLTVLYDPAIVKVLHSARQDLEVLFDLRHDLPQNLFDTQIAAMFLGYGEQIGYAGLVKEKMAVELGKTQTRTDWSRRPLNPQQLAYAADDVRYLLPLYRQLGKELEDRQRLQWFQEECQALSEVSILGRDSESLWQRVKNWQVLRGQELAFLRLLVEWREAEAVSSNRPRRWILADEVLLELAKLQPVDLAGLTGVVPEKVLQRYGQPLLEVMAQARVMAVEEWPRPAAKSELTAAQKARLKQLQANTRRVAEKLDIPPSLLAKRRELERLARDEPAPQLQSGWRQALFLEIIA